MSTTPHSDDLLYPDSFIKDIAFELPDYEFFHTAFYTNIKDDFSKYFIGREALEKDLVTRLWSPVKKGVYLVTGYRGMGKTTFVNKSIDRYKYPGDNDPLITGDQFKEAWSPDNKVIDVRIGLSKKGVEELDIFHIITKELYANIKEHSVFYKKTTALKLRKATTLHWLLFFLLSFSMLLILNQLHLFNNKYLYNWLSDCFGTIYTYKLFAGIIISLLSGTILFLLARYLYCFHRQKIWKINADKDDDPFIRIGHLYNRLHASQAVEQEAAENFSFQAVGTILRGKQEKKITNYPIANVKEIESEILDILRSIKKGDRKFLNKSLQFIFIFDELDKIDPVNSDLFQPEHLDPEEKKKVLSITHFHQFRERQKTIINLIAGLKNFLSTAEARFIFIAGREMFEASIADIADRQSSLGSIFNHIFYVESFLKENSENNITTRIERLLSLILLGRKHTNKPGQDAILYEDYINQVYKERYEHFSDLIKQKIVFTLQNFIVYLTYRCNGSPQKLIKTIEGFIKPGDAVSQNNGLLLVGIQKPGTDPSPKRYLYFNFYEQYKLNLVSYLFRPFLVLNGRYFNVYSDNILFSTPYLFDHLLKFHAYAFSLSNLELIPEVLSTNKTPTLKYYIEYMVNYLSNNHIRVTEIRLFDYKFFSKTYHELTFISKIFEEESAAFNFTLDESHLVKLHVRHKIQEHKNYYKDLLSGSDKTQQIFSIAFLNGLLGDLHFFDQEYDDAITCYSDAIKPINIMKVENLNFRDFMTLIRFKLKLGLCFEKMISLEEALTFYSDAVNDTKRYLYSYMAVSSRQPEWREFREAFPVETPDITPGQFPDLPDDKSEIKNVFPSSALNDLLQTVNQCFIASAFLEEKMSLEGFTRQKFRINFFGLHQVVHKTGYICGNNHLILSNYFLCIGNLLYYKNYRPETSLESKEKKRSHNKKFVTAEHTLFLEGFGLGAGAADMNYSTLECYLVGLHYVINSLDKPIDISGWKKLISNIPPQFIKNRSLPNKTTQRYLAVFFSNIADCLFSQLKNDNGYNTFTIDQVFSVLPDATYFKQKRNNPNETWAAVMDMQYLLFGDNKLKAFSNDSLKSNIKTVVFLYYLSGVFYKISGKCVSYGFQLRKILYVLRMVISESCPQTRHWKQKRQSFLRIIKTKLVREILVVISENSVLSDRPQTNKFKAFTTSRGIKGLPQFISNNPESKEVIILYAHIKTRLQAFMNPGSLITPYNLVSTQYSRIIELQFNAKTVLTKLKTLQKSHGIDFNDLSTRKLLLDYFYTLFTLVRTINIYGTDYMIGFATLGYTHYRIAKGTQEYLMPLPLCRQKEISAAINRLCNVAEDRILDYRYHYHMSKTNYEKVIQVHNGSYEYKHSITNMIYLEDDFNDNAHHFGAALERYLITNHEVQNKINAAKQHIHKSEHYKIENFLFDKQPGKRLVKNCPVQPPLP